MLSDEDKARIKAEEEYRVQARAEAEGRASPTPFVMRPLESPKPDPIVPGLTSAHIVSGVFMLVIGLVIVGWIINSVNKSVADAGRSLPPSEPPPAVISTAHTVRYAITTTCESASLTFSNAGGDTAQLGAAPDGWSKTFEAQNGLFLYLSAQASCDGQITVYIKIDGVLVKTNTSTGEYVIASVSGKL